MTGFEDFNFPAFKMAADLRAHGYVVENPAEHGVVEDADWADYMRAWACVEWWRSCPGGKTRKAPGSKCTLPASSACRL